MAGLAERIKPLLPGAAFILATGSFLAFLAPYNTAQLGWPGVWFYWTGLIAFGAACGQLAGRLTEPLMQSWPEWTHYAAVSVLISVPITGAVIALQGLLGDPHRLSTWPILFFFVWVISAAVSAISYLTDRRAAEAAAGTPQPGRALTDKLPVRLRRAEIWALESEDHYLRVHTAVGDALILMRLADAVAAVEALDGGQTHRSWWVNRTAVTDARPSGGRAILTLKDGTKAPVSRSFYPKLREAGWF